MALIDSSGSDLEGNAPLHARGLQADLLRLPPLPDQDLCQMRAEASCGNTLVLFLIFLFVAPMQAYANSQGSNLSTIQRIWLAAIYAEAATAIFCLLGLMWDDPGTIKRTVENCFPQPDIVADKLANGESLDSVGNIAGDDGRVFCIRCLVWRPDDHNTHHCSTCQRCVVEFDHHCGVCVVPSEPRSTRMHAYTRWEDGQPRSAHAQVFGRCIAGDGCGGNMGYFKTLILMGVLGCGKFYQNVCSSNAPFKRAAYTDSFVQPHRLRSHMRLLHGDVDQPIVSIWALPASRAWLTLHQSAIWALSVRRCLPGGLLDASRRR